MKLTACVVVVHTILLCPELKSLEQSLHPFGDDDGEGDAQQEPRPHHRNQVELFLAHRHEQGQRAGGVRAEQHHSAEDDQLRQPLHLGS